MLLADRYRLDIPLGHGGMGEVWTAVDERLNRPVAVKLLTGLEKSGSRARFHREARVAARLDHPRIVAVYDFGISDDRCFLATELVNGPGLAHELNRRGRLSPARVAAAAAQAAEGLAEAHRQGVVHGDVKPSNLLLDENGMVKIADFGVAWCSQTTYTTATGLVRAGHYPAPETAQGEEAGAPGDVYALGCTLYELLVGSSPFSADSPGTVPWQDLPQPYGDILPRMLGTSPDERPEAEEVAGWFARVSARADNPVADPHNGGDSAPAKRTTTARHRDSRDSDERTTVAASTGAAAASARRRRRWPAVAGAVTTAAALTAGMVALTGPTADSVHGTGSSPQLTVPGPADGPYTPSTRAGTSSGQQSGTPAQVSSGSPSQPGVAGPTASGSLSPTTPSRSHPTATPTKTPSPTTTRTASPSPSPSTSPSTDPSPTPSST